MPQELFEGGTDARYSPTGHIVYAVGSTLFAVPFDAKARALKGSPVPVLEGVRRVPSLTTGAAQFSLSTTGTLAYLSGSSDASDVQLTIVDRDGDRRPLEIPSGTYFQPRISPDGQTLAVERFEGRETNVWLYPINGGAQGRRLTFGGTFNGRPMWTKDRKQIVFQSDRQGGVRGLFWQRADGSTPAEPFAVAEAGTTLQPEGWAGDTTLIVSSAKGSVRSLAAVTAGSGNLPKPLVPAWSSNSSLSPDGRWIAYQTMVAGGFEVYVEPFPPTGAKSLPTPNGSSNPLWSLDGHELFYLQTQSIGAQLMAATIRFDPVFRIERVTALPIEGVVQVSARAYDVTPDGKRFVVMLPKSVATTGGPPVEQINVALNWFQELKEKAPN